ncbi:amino acid permease-associated region protein [Weissella oryzae SG25]|uniref:Amino acid permease-associated region protein n=1 Tax=Weissella oryzae (strain DSM 25784 / JCM 18191 / LMG 30913 / SG25) TaxID=1329250 RepID=A0A069CQU4_WEIOS|nr:APC family permease [Weissella oryzae]GAK30075.1 amino acid permease-associated region protein [Weissella oryzae SG25]
MAESTNFGYKQELKRTLSVRDMVIYGMIFMVPIAPFGIYGQVASQAKGMVPLAYLIGMIAMVFTALSYKQLSEEFPVAGSVYSYAQRGIHPIIGFFAGWAMLLDYVLVPSLLYVVAAVALTGIVPVVPAWVWIIIFVLFNTVVNIMGIEFTAKANFVILAFELVVLIIFISLGIIAIVNGLGGGFTLKPFYDPHYFSMKLVMGSVSLAVLSFLGFDGISTLAEEAKDGPKSVGKACLWALFVIGTLFMLQTYIAASVWPHFQSLDPNNAFYQIAQAVGGVFLSKVAMISTVISWGIANALAAQAAVARILYSMSRDGFLPKALAKVHPVRKTPYVSTFVIAIISLLVGLGFQNDIANLSTMVNFGAMTAFLVLHLSVINHFIFRKKSKAYFKHLVLPLVGFVIIFYVWLSFQSLAYIVGGT